jgi:hypothetical protein
MAPWVLGELQELVTQRGSPGKPDGTDERTTGRLCGARGARARTWGPWVSLTSGAGMISECMEMNRKYNTDPFGRSGGKEHMYHACMANQGHYH